MTRPFIMKELTKRGTPIYHLLYAEETKSKSFLSFRAAQAEKKRLTIAEIKDEKRLRQKPKFYWR